MVGVKTCADQREERHRGERNAKPEHSEAENGTKCEDEGLGETVAMRMGLRVLIVRVGAMGDVLHALPAVSALREQLPDCFIGWAIEPGWRALLEAGESRPVVDRVHEVPTKAWKARPLGRETLDEIRALRAEMRAERYDVCVDLQGSIRSAFVGRLAGAGRLVGMARPREAPARWLYGTRVEVRAEHVIGQGCELVSAAVGMELTAGVAQVALDEAARRRCRLRLEKMGFERGERFVFLTAGAGWGAKRWPVERFREVAVRLREAGFRTVVNASSDGDPVAGAVAAGWAADVFACSMEELGAVVREAALVIGGDTGPVQMAGAVGTPVVTLFGPTDPARTGPQGFVGSRVRVLRDAGSVVDHARHAETEAGLMRISVEAVVRAGLEMLG